MESDLHMKGLTGLNHENEDESFNKLTYAFVSKLAFCDNAVHSNLKAITFLTIKNFDLSPYIKTVCGNPAVLADMRKYVPEETIQQIQAQFLI